MINDQEHKVYHIFKEKYGGSDAEEIITCINNIRLFRQGRYEERLRKVLMNNNWEDEDARFFVNAIGEIAAGFNSPVP